MEIPIIREVTRFFGLIYLFIYLICLFVIMKKCSDGLDCLWFDGHTCASTHKHTHTHTRKQTHANTHTHTAFLSMVLLKMRSSSPNQHISFFTMGTMSFSGKSKELC